MKALPQMSFVLVLIALVQMPSVANGEGAEVRNHAIGAHAFFWVGETKYDGPATLVLTPKGDVRGSAHTEVVCGTAVTQTTVITRVFSTKFGLVEAEIVLTPAGKGRVHFLELLVP